MRRRYCITVNVICALTGASPAGDVADEALGAVVVSRAAVAAQKLTFALIADPIVQDRATQTRGRGSGAPS